MRTFASPAIPKIVYISFVAVRLTSFAVPGARRHLRFRRWIAQEDAEAHYVWANTQPAAGTPYFLLSIRRHGNDFVFLCDLIPRYDLNCNAW